MAEPFRDSKSQCFYVSFSYAGKRYKRSTGSSSLATARRAQHIVDGRVAELKAGLIQVPEGVTVAEFIFEGKQTPNRSPDGKSLAGFFAAYLREAAPPNKARSTYQTEQIHVKHLKAFAQSQGVADLSGLDHAFFESYKRWRHAAGKTNVTINKELGAFQTMMNAAVRSGLLDANPLQGVKRLKEDALFERFHTGEEIKALLAKGGHSPEEIARLRRFRYLGNEELKRLLDLARGCEIYAFIVTAACTGMRLSEMLRLRWSDVDFANKRILARGTKGSTTRQESPRHIPLHPRLAEVLAERQAQSKDALVFAGPEGRELTKDYYNYHLKGLLAGTEFEGITWHVFRHSVASNLAAAGVDQRVIDQLMGHSTTEMSHRYQHLRPSLQQDAIMKLDF